jgi:hypothetical protein
MIRQLAPALPINPPLVWAKAAYRVSENSRIKQQREGNVCEQARAERAASSWCCRDTSPDVHARARLEFDATAESDVAGGHISPPDVVCQRRCKTPQKCRLKIPQVG